MNQLKNKVSRVLSPADAMRRAFDKQNKANEAMVQKIMGSNQGINTSAVPLVGGTYSGGGRGGSGGGLGGYAGVGLGGYAGIVRADMQNFDSDYVFGNYQFSNYLSPAQFSHYLTPSPDSLTESKSDAPVAVVAKPSMDILERTCLAVQDLDFEQPRTVLALDAENMLGYQPLRREMHVDPPLKRTLAKLEMEVLVASTVDKYKAMMVEHFRTTKQMADPTWNLVELNYYSKPVPEFVLSKCVEIKKELPQARFWVEELREDPFMVVGLGKETYYLDVWDEPRFESHFGQRLIE